MRWPRPGPWETACGSVFRLWASRQSRFLRGRLHPQGRPRRSRRRTGAARAARSGPPPPNLHRPERPPACRPPPPELLAWCCGRRAREIAWRPLRRALGAAPPNRAARRPHPSAGPAPAARPVRAAARPERLTAYEQVDQPGRYGRAAQRLQAGVELHGGVAGGGELLRWQGIEVDHMTSVGLPARRRPSRRMDCCPRRAFCRTPGIGSWQVFTEGGSSHGDQGQRRSGARIAQWAGGR